MNNEKTPTYKRVLAWIGIIILAGMYIVLLYEAVTASPNTINVFMGCVAATIAVPILLWLIIWSVGIFTGRHTVASLDAMTSDKKHDKFGNVIPDGRIDTVVFDIGNVLTNFAWKEFMENKGFDREMTERIGRATVNSSDWKEIDRGIISNEELLDRFVQNDPGIENEIRHAFSDYKDIVTKRDYAIPWIKSLKAEGFKVLVLSNFSRQAIEGCKDAMGFLDYVDGGILSYRDKVIKPDPAIYRLLEERYSLTPEKTVFIDDTPENIEAARDLGWHGIVFSSKEQAEEELRSYCLGTKH